MSSSAEALLIQEEGLLIQPMLYEKYTIVDKGMVISSAIEVFNKDNRFCLWQQTMMII